MKRRGFLAMSAVGLFTGCPVSEKRLTGSASESEPTNTDGAQVSLTEIHLWNTLSERVQFEIRVWADGRTAFGKFYSLEPDEQKHITEISARAQGESIVVVGGYDGGHTSMGYNSSGADTRETAFIIKSDGDVALDGTGWTER
ncbi:hypothetical protein [Haloferax mucosum]|uniref:hypothetical protein n=1 Tax=Haloferax mucosum TaxID=403181 RepID=UPI001267454B|nr:hypothetical protein [Haloferax mucosum]